MKKYAFTSSIIKIGQIICVLMIGIGLLLSLIAFEQGFLPTGLISILLILNGILMSLGVELLAIFRDIAINTKKTNELLEKKSEE